MDELLGEFAPNNVRSAIAPQEPDYRIVDALTECTADQAMAPVSARPGYGSGMATALVPADHGVDAVLL